MSLLAHIAAGRPQKETIATAALAYILNGSQSCRRRLSNFLSRSVGREFNGFDRVLVEEPLEGGGRPDVSLTRQDGTLLGFVEAKFWAGLTDAQPVRYLDALRAHAGAVLVVVAPERRIPALREELVGRCQNVGATVALESEDRICCDETHIVLLSWAQVLHELSIAAQGDPTALGDVEQLRGLCALVEEESNFSMSSEELSDVSGARRVRMLNQLVDDFVEALVHTGRADRQGLNRTPREWGYGRYLKLPHGVVWVGNDNFSWAQFGRGPLWIVFLAQEARGMGLHRALQVWMRASPALAYVDDQDGRVLIPLPMQPGALRQELIEGFLRFTERLVAHLDEAGVRRAGED